MSNRNKWLLAAVLFLLLGVTSWLNHAPALAAKPQDERPPIVIHEGSIHFNFGAGWIQHATSKGSWIANLKSDPQGPGVSQFDAIATATTATAKNVCLLTGTQLTIDYADGTQTLQFTLAIDPAGAVLRPPPGTQLTAARHWNLRTGKTKAGAITRAAAGGQSCTFSPAEDVRVVVSLRP